MVFRKRRQPIRRPVPVQRRPKQRQSDNMFERMGASFEQMGIDAGNMV